MYRTILRLAGIALTAIPVAGCMTKSGEEQPFLTTRQTSLITAADEVAAMARLHSIAQAEAIYQAERDGEYATLEELIENGLVRDPSKGKAARYRFEVVVKPNGFEATAVPEKWGVTGRRSFYVDETLVMRGADKGGEKATASDPEI
jgi:hypothetical protein